MVDLPWLLLELNLCYVQTWYMCIIYLYIYIYGLTKQIWYTGIPIVAMYIAVHLYNQMIMLTLSIGLG